MHRRLMTAGVVVLTAALTWLALPSVAFGSSLIVIKGRGWGNGVGLSQWGANGYAQHGWRYNGILAHYYPHTTLGTAANQPVRVLLAANVRSLNVGSARAFVVLDSSGQKISAPAGALHLTTALQIGKETLTPPLTIEPGEQPLTLNGAGYRGSFVVSRVDGALMVVNSVPLERYVRGVVPSEMPADWKAAAYEAQAVAARSYALASLRPTAAFDLYADNRSQVYGGIRSERPQTNLAVGATAGQVLTYDDRVIEAEYDSDSGGRTAAVQDVFPANAPEPYLVSVSDPYDGGSPNRRWQITVPATALSHRFDVPVTDVRVQRNRSGRASGIQLLAGASRRILSAASFSRALQLRSTYFTIGVASLETPSSPSAPGKRVVLRGFLRDVSGAVLQQQSGSGTWTPVEPIVPAPNGRFQVAVVPDGTTAYRLALGAAAGEPVTAIVAKAVSQRERIKRPIPVSTVTIKGP